MNKRYLLEMRNSGEFNGLYLTPKGLMKDIPTMDENYTWKSKEEAHEEGMKEVKNWYNPHRVDFFITEIDI